MKRGKKVGWAVTQEVGTLFSMGEALVQPLMLTIQKEKSPKHDTNKNLLMD